MNKQDLLKELECVSKKDLEEIEIFIRQRINRIKRLHVSRIYAENTIARKRREEYIQSLPIHPVCKI